MSINTLHKGDDDDDDDDDDNNNNLSTCGKDRYQGCEIISQNAYFT